MNIEIDLDKVVDEATKMIAEKVVNDYLDARDIDDWKTREKITAQRTKKIIDKMDWSAAPDGLSQAAAKTFFERIIEKVR